MMKIAMWACAACLPVLEAAAAPTAAELLSLCRPVASGGISGEYAKFPQNFDTGICWGVFSAIQQTSRYMKDGRTLMGVCAPPTSRTSQLVAIFVRYAESRPQQHHEDGIDLAYESLSNAFPCPSRK